MMSNSNETKISELEYLVLLEQAYMRRGLEGLSLKVDSYIIEITRDCNIECAHCFRGDKQEEHMSKETINNIINSMGSNKISIKFTGGEPFLNAEGIKHFLSDLQKKDKQIRRIHIITNGTINDPDIYDMLNGFEGYRDKYRISISKDKYHTLAIKEAGLIKEAKEAKGLIKDSFKNTGFEKLNGLFVKGRATILEDDFKLKPDIADDMTLNFNGIEDGQVKTNVHRLYVNVKGDVLVNFNVPFAEQDDYLLGNINDSALTEILFKFQMGRLYDSLSLGKFEKETYEEYVNNANKILDMQLDSNVEFAV